MKIYIASKVKHAAKWLDLKTQGVNIISTWIKKAGTLKDEDKAKLQGDCIREVMEADIIIVYREPGEHLVGAYIELGAAMATFKPVYLVGIVNILKPDSVFYYYPSLRNCSTIEEAIEKIYGQIVQPSYEEPKEELTWQFHLHLHLFENFKMPFSERQPIVNSANDLINKLTEETKNLCRFCEGKGTAISGETQQVIICPLCKGNKVEQAKPEEEPKETVSKEEALRLFLGPEWKFEKNEWYNSYEKNPYRFSTEQLYLLFCAFAKKNTISKTIK